LKNYWAEQVAELPWAQLHTSLKPEFGCAIGLLNMEGMKPGELAQTLFREHQIFTVAIEWEKASGIRVTPNVFTLQSELDR
ncbi:MAG: aminotransferase, partial [Saprospiraceae bacterium]|nr:aminotransferase [Saprospiraceae bacterium]